MKNDQRVMDPQWNSNDIEFKKKHTGNGAKLAAAFLASPWQENTLKLRSYIYTTILILIFWLVGMGVDINNNLALFANKYPSIFHLILTIFLVIIVLQYKIFSFGDLMLNKYKIREPLET